MAKSLRLLIYSYIKLKNFIITCSFSITLQTRTIAKIKKSVEKIKFQ